MSTAALVSGALGVGVLGTLAAIYTPQLFATGVSALTGGLVGVLATMVPFIAVGSVKNRGRSAGGRGAGAGLVVGFYGGIAVGAVNVLFLMSTGAWSAVTQNPGAMALLLSGFESKFLVAFNVLAALAGAVGGFVLT